VAERGRLGRTLARWANTSEQIERDLRATHTSKGQTSLADAPERERVRVRGTLRTVTLRPRGGVPALEAELSDGTGVLIIVWLGRRRIVGIEPGRALVVEGRIGTAHGARTIFNPRYELLP
jgi:RecG-like helicase